MSRATLTQLVQLGLDSYALSQMLPADLQVALDAAADKIDGIIGTQYPPPILAPFPMDLIECECVEASWTALNVRGYRPASTGDDSIKRRHDEWMSEEGWIGKVSRGEYVPKIISAGASSDAGASGPEVITATTRGYSERGVSPFNPPTIQTNAFSDD
jgi:hypothetical protein